jgi:NADPH2:quinone reductase
MTLNTFKAIGITRSLPLSDPTSFQLFTLPIPKIEDRDVLVQIKAFAINPVDTKVRKGMGNDVLPDTAPRILGWDACGVIVGKGKSVVGFDIGDEVFYAGNLRRSGSNATHQLVDFGLIAHKPKSIDYAQSAALPLTSLTAWELLERMHIHESSEEKTVLVIGGAGGVGSMMIQRLKQLNKKVIATASREESKQWCLSLGADVVVDHRKGLSAALSEHGITEVDAIVNLVNTDTYWEETGKLIAPEGVIGLIVESGPLDMSTIKFKSVRLAHEFMFTRAMSDNPNRKAKQGKILQEVAQMVDKQQLKTTLTTTLTGLSVENLQKAHQKIEQHNTIGKVVISL